MHSIYEKYGYYGEALVDIYMEGSDGIERIRKIMASLRKDPPKTLADLPLKKIGDYLSGEFTDLNTKEISPTAQPTSDVLYYVLSNDDKIIIRPSGTEPKVKIYALAHAKGEKELSEKISVYKECAKKLVES